MKAIILAAGEGTRLRPYTLDRPKCLVEIDGVSLLDRQLAVLRSCGIDEIVLIGGYRCEMLQNKATRLHLNPRYAETNMVWTLFCADEELVGDVVISYGDIVYSGTILESLMASQADIAGAVDIEWESYWRARSNDPLADAETLRLAEDGSILEIGQRPESLEEIEGQYMGLMKFSAAGLTSLKAVFQAARAMDQLRGKPPEKAYMTDLLQALIDDGVRVEAVHVRGPWVEIDTVNDLVSDSTINRVLCMEAGDDQPA